MYIIFVINSLDKEKEIIRNAEKYKKWFDDHNIMTNFPKQEVETEYRQERYSEFKEKVARDWEIVENMFFDKLVSLFNLKIEEPFKICITNYGAMGFYNAPMRTIFINMNYNGDFSRLIAHELIHVMVEPFIQKFKIDQERKENLVNAVLEVLKPE